MSALVFVVSDDWIQDAIFFLVSPALLFALLILLLVAVLERRYRRPYLWLAGAIALFFVTAAALIAYQQGDLQCIRSTARWMCKAMVNVWDCPHIVDVVDIICGR